MNIKALVGSRVRLTMLAIVALVLVGSAGLFGYGTPNGTMISNAKTLGLLDMRLATNAGQLSANFENGSGVTNFGNIIGAPAVTKVTQGFDMSVMFMTTQVTQTISAGNVAQFTVYVTNWGNSSALLGCGLTNRGATAGWSNQKYVIRVNTITVSTNNASLSPSGTNTTAAGSVFRVDILVYAPTWLGDNSTNAFEFRVGNRSLPVVGMGDNWPGPLAILPSTTDTNATTGGTRDWQGRYCLVRISGPILRLSKSVSVASLKPYELMTYTISYTNAGTAAATSVRIQDVLPSFTTNLSGERIWTNGSATTNVIVPTVVGKRVQFTPGAGVIAPGGYGRIFFTVKVK